MKKIDVVPTVEAIRHFAQQLRTQAAELDRIADQMVATSDIGLAANAVNVATRQVGPMDWLIDRPLRALADSLE